MSIQIEKFEELRKKFPVFYYQDFSYSIQEDQLEVAYNYSIHKEFFFTHKLIFPKRLFYNFNLLSDRQLQILLFNIGLIELVSYWKCVCSPTVVVAPFYLNKDQIGFWKKLYFNGLGEFFYINKIPAAIDDFMDIVCPSSSNLEKQEFHLEDKTIVPVGGGKDSVVTMEILLQAGENVKPLIINSRDATGDCIKTAGFLQKDIIEVIRVIDPKLLELNASGFLNGHTPFSAMLAFVSLLCAAISGRKNIALSNESSANESTVKGTNINHQYSKSFEFEKDFREYVAAFISDDFNYFSFLRPLNELQIAGLFAEYEKYFPVFRSCNVGSKTNSWCASCPKCLFVFCMLSPFVTPDDLQQIFGKNLFSDEELLPVFKQLIGEGDKKPFECVGTIEEMNVALQLTIDKYYNLQNLPVLLDYYIQKNKGNALNNTGIFHYFDSQNFLISKFENILRNRLDF